jgi:hypothetical protein
MCTAAGVLVGIFAFILSVYLIVIFGVFKPTCPKVNGIECNGYGVCQGGFCRCDPRFSGVGCASTGIPVYNPLTRVQCNGNGFGWPFSNFSSFCQQTVVGGQLVGPGWDGEECKNHLERTVQQLKEANNNRFLVPNSTTIPWCQCYPPWGGVGCDVKGCPSDENGLICGGNGNKSVGILTNQTNSEQTGCQCTTQVRYDVPPLLGLFTPVQQQSIATTYYGLFSQRLCAQPALFSTLTGAFEQNPLVNPSNLTVIDNDGVYGCFCDFGWAGPVCTENQCPRSLQSHVICSGVGHPGFGQGLITNTTKQTSKGLQCTVKCEEGTEICGTQSCVKTQSPDTPLFSNSRVCTYGSQCTSTSPVRCFDGSCVPIPLNSRECTLNYETGSIDPIFLDTLLNPCTIRTDSELEVCFGVSGLQAVSYNRDGFVWNTSLPIQFSTTTPLVYFQFSTNSSSVVVSALWSRQTIVYENFTALVSGSFRYNDTGAWITEPDERVFVNQDALGYNICNLTSYNYSGSIGIPTNYTKIRVRDLQGALVYIFDVQGSSVALVPVVNQSFILVSTTPAITAQQWFFPSGDVGTRGDCLSDPGQCSFIVWADQVRNLDSTNFLCSSGGLPILQSTPCPTPWSTLRNTLSQYVTSWMTCLIGATSFDAPTLIGAQTFRLDRNYTTRSVYENEIRFLPEGGVVQVSFPAFLRQQDVLFPCACNPAQQETNRSILDAQWWGESGLRPVGDLELGDWILSSTIVDGSQKFLRSKIVGFSQLNSSFTVWNPQLDLYYDSFYSNSRSISISEVLKGSSDGDMIIAPYRCPDGQQSAADSIAMAVPANCNCTLTTPLVDCTCNDRMAQNWTCSCQLDEGYCQCTPPALPEFEMRLFRQLELLTNTSCQCIIYDPQPGESTNSSLTVYGFAEFNISLSQVPQFLILKTSGVDCNNSNEVNVTALNPRLFINRTIPVIVLQGDVSNCEHWYTLTWPNEQAISRVVVESTQTIEWATLTFSVNGFSLTSLSPSTIFRATSQELSPSSVVELRNGTFWSSNQTTLPVFIEMDLGRAVLVNYVTVVFYESGVKFGTSEIPWRIYLQGWLTAKGGWKSIVSFGVYVERGGWAERSLSIENPEQFSKFRLITEYGNFAIRQWFMYTNQACLCEDGSLLTLELTSTLGLPTIQSILNEIDAYNPELIGAGCVCTNECNLKIGIEGSNSTFNFANDGQCEDAINVAFIQGFTPVAELIANQTVEITPGPYKLYTHEVFPGVSSIQTATNESLFLGLADQQFLYTGQEQSNFPNFPPVPNDPNVTQAPNQTIYYFNTTTLVTIPTQIPRGDPYNVITYINGTFFFLVQNYTINYGGVVERGDACCAGCDCDDCGSSIRNQPIQTGVRCDFTPEQSRLLELMGLGNVLVNQTYYVQNLTASLNTNWTAIYENIVTTRTQAVSVLANCPGQVCELPNHYRCLNGRCVQYAEECEVLYNCPGNGCVQQTDAASPGNVAYRCACQLGFAGDACQFGPAKPAAPLIFPGQYGYVPGALAIHCGGLPPLRMLPPVVNQKQFMQPPEIVAENLKQTANSPKRTAQQINYFRVMPSNGWGPVITFPWTLLDTSLDVMSQDEQTFVSDCAPARRGYRGEAILLTDDLAGEDPVTGAPIWRVYTNPFTNQNETFTWDGVFPLRNGVRYHDFPYRCLNGQCVARPGLCAQSEALFPSCNGQGECRADGSCLCRAGRKTGTVNSRISELVKYPYTVENGVPNPTVWELNWNWKYFGLLQCLERDCEEEFCGTPTGCYPGTPERSFIDRWHFCLDSTRNYGRCAPPGTDCNAATGLQLPLVCSGNGIPKVKDFTGESYCHCGSPISKTASISEITQITDLQKNGWGGVACETYYAPSATLTWSAWDFQNDEPYRSSVTDEILPGKWIQGVALVGPDPDQRVLWENCCVGGVCCSSFSRLELCPNVVCDQDGVLTCTLASECILPQVPQIFPCNNHGVARADGTCLCDSSQEKGFGYTNDFTQFSIDGCYREFQCPISKRNNAPCYFLEACSHPEEFRYPAPPDLYLAQQPYMCGPQQGLIQNSTILTQIATSANIFLDRLIQALTQIAIEVGNAIVALGGCICVYPDDTESEKFGMLPGANFTYLQSYHSPSLLFGHFPGYPFLTDFTLETYGNESYLIAANTTIEFQFTNTSDTNISALRIYADQVQNGSVINVLRSDGVTTVCDQLLPQASGFPLSWISSSRYPPVTAFYCGPLFTCATFESDPGFNLNCGASSLIQACTNWKTAQCLADPGQYIYWPLDSPAIYEGCERGAGGCTCCRKNTNTGYPPIKDGRVKLQFTSAMRVGQINIFGVTEQALPYPPGLSNRLQKRLPDSIDAASCQDYQYLSGALGAPETYFIQFPPNNSATAPPQKTYDEAFLDCNDTGSYLAIPQTVGEAVGLPGTSNPLMRECNLLTGTDKKECWVGARDTKYNELYTGRSDMINGCTTCFEPAFCSGRTCPISFSTYPGAPNTTAPSAANYKAPAFTGQISSLQVINTLFPVVNGQRVQTRNLYTQLSGTGDILASCRYYLTFQLNSYGQTTAGGAYLFLTFLFFFEGNFNTPQKVRSVTAIYSNTYPLIQTPSQITELCPATLSCRYVGLKPGERVDIEYGEQFTVNVELCQKFDWGRTDADNSFAFCTTLLQNPVLKSLQMRPTTCGRISYYKKSLCSIFSRKDINAATPFVQPTFVYTGESCNWLARLPGLAWAKPPWGSGSAYQDFWEIDCGDDIVFNELKNDGYGCTAFFTRDPYYEIQLTMHTTQMESSGEFGNNFIAGVSQYPYIPVFVQMTIVKTQQSDLAVNSNFGQVLVANNIPIYFTGMPFGFKKLPYIWSASDTPVCSQCYNQLNGNFQWYSLIYERNFDGWLGSVDANPFQLPPVRIYVRRIGTEGTDLQLLQVPGFNNRLGQLDIDTFVHLTTYIESRNKTAAAGRTDTYQWYLSTCLAVNASSYILKVCSDKLSYICQYDYMRYAVVNGYQCPACGDSTRVGFTPRAGVTCYDSNPLANQTAFPVEHIVYDNYLRKTLLYYASTITSPAQLSLPAGNVVWGIPECWESWAAGRGTRGPESGGKLPRGQLPSLNWYDMCLSCNWGVDCQKEQFSIRDPNTNEEVRTCATVSQLCDLSQPVTGNNPLQAGYYPPIFSPVESQTAALTDPTCGEVVLLSSFSVVDKFGVPQSGLLVNFTLLEATSKFVQLQVATTQAYWFNSGKSNIPSSKFSWNYTTTVYGQYELISCPGGCTGATMDIIIYPLSIGYEFPTRIIRRTINLVQNSLAFYSENFTVTTTDTGIFTVNGQSFPLFPFQGVGFDLSNLPVGTVIYLYNPVVIDPLTINQCTTRQPPQLVEPLTRITSTVPYNKCIFNDELQAEFPGQDIGTCGCSFALAGEMCDCIAVTTKYTERVCGGFGAEGVLAFGYDGQFYSTGEGQNGGCYLMANGKTDCFTKDVGKCIFTLLVDGAIWNYPSVYIDTPPANGQSLFIRLEGEGGTYTEAISLCRINGNQLAYWYTADEMTQFVQTAQIPSFIAANSTPGYTSWPWDNDQPGTFFVNTATTPIIFASTEGAFSCATTPSACLALNFNNLAYNGSSCLTDGNTITPCLSGGDIFYQGPIQIYVVLFPNSTGGATCIESGGRCTTPVEFTKSSQFTCRCPYQAIRVGGGVSEVQIFSDLFRTNLYDYN